jgi:hypothetical protein
MYFNCSSNDFGANVILHICGLRLSKFSKKIKRRGAETQRVVIGI